MRPTMHRRVTESKGLFPGGAKNAPIVSFGGVPTTGVPSVARGAKMAERGGFEPPVRCYTYNALAKRRYRPLSHLSKTKSLKQRDES